MTHLQLISSPGVTSSCDSPGDVPLLGTEGGEEEQEAEVEHLGGECVESPGEQ